MPTPRSPGALPPPSTFVLALVVATVVVVAACAPGSTASPGGTTSALPSALPTFTRPTPTPQPTFLTYIVRTGDSLTSIAKAYRTTARSIAFWNRATYPSLDPESPGYAPDRIGVGWRLVLIPGAVVDETALPTPSPSSSGSSAPSAPIPTPGADGASAVLTHGDRGSREIALTFELGQRLEGAVGVVDWLVAHDVPATVFLTGQTATTTDAGRVVATRLRQQALLLEVGNGTWDGADLTDLDAASIGDELTRAEAAIAPAVGRSTTPWVRPPDGAWNDAVRAAVGHAGWRYLVVWDVDPRDADPTSQGGPTADDLVTRVLSGASGGSIVRLHLDGDHTLEALPAIVDGLRSRGLTPVTLSALVGG